MNTLEVQVEHHIETLDEFYQTAKEQFLSYEKLEGIPDWGAHDFSIDCADDQARFKDMLEIRFVEELTEASACLNEGIEHFLEEITDSINFLLSAYIMAGYSPLTDLPSIESFLAKDFIGIIKPNSIDDMAIPAYNLVHRVGWACNLLKNRPWAQSNYLVDLLQFKERLVDLWIYFWKWIGSLGIDKKMLFDLFERKVEVNKFRIQTGY
jgi:hypothetical protein